jgi:hypothetical protein
VETGHPIEPVAEDMLADFRDCGWPAILAAVDSPGFKPDPTTSRATSSPKKIPPQTRCGNSARPPSRLIPVGDQKTDALFTELADREPNTR